MNLSALLPSEDFVANLTIIRLIYSASNIESVKYSSEDNLFCDFSLPAYLLDPIYHSELLLKICGVLYTPRPQFRICPIK